MSPAIKKSIRFISIVFICVIVIYRLYIYEEFGSLEIPEEFTGKPLFHLGMSEEELLNIRKIHKVENESVSYSYDEDYNTEICKRIVYVLESSFGKYKLKLIIIKNEKLKDIQYNNEKQCDSVALSYENMVRGAIKICQRHHGSGYQVYKHTIPIKNQNLLFYYIVWHTSEGLVEISYYPPETVKKLIYLGDSSFGNSNEILYDSDDHSFPSYQGFSECNSEEINKLGF